MLQLARGVQRVDVDHHVAGAQDAGHGGRVLRHVGHHDGHAVAARQTQALQVAGHGAALGVGLGVADVLAHEAVGGAVCKLLEALVHQRHQRRVLRGVDVGGNAFGVVLEPDALGHGCVLLARWRRRARGRVGQGPARVGRFITLCDANTPRGTGVFLEGDQTPFKVSSNDTYRTTVRKSSRTMRRGRNVAAYSIALPMSSTTFLASPNTIMVLSM